MTDLSTTYMGLKLANPLVVASCSLTNTPEKVQRCEEVGAGAVVLKSLFEEQIKAETERGIEDFLWLSGHTEAFEYVQNMGMQLEPSAYLHLIEEAKKRVSIPIIASLNCITAKWWADYTTQIAAAGADGLELNIAVMPSDPMRKSERIERLYVDILGEVSSRTKLPIAIKMHPYFTNLARMAEQLCRRGAAALVFFNRFYQLDVDIQTMKLKAGSRFSSPQEVYTPLRWVMLLADRIQCDLAASTGIHDTEAVIKHLLAGATITQLCSTLYLNDLDRVETMREDLRHWMRQQGIASLTEIRGKLKQMESPHPELYERLQYIKALVGIE